jgi:type II secretion system protein G
MGCSPLHRCLSGIRTSTLSCGRSTNMIKRIRQRLDGNTEQGFTLIELLVVIIIIGILLAIAVPSYLGFRDRAANSAAKANLRAALPAAEAYYSDKGTYTGMDKAALKGYDTGVSDTLKVTAVSDASYTLCDDPSGKAWQVVGPGPASSDFTSIASC